MTALIQVSFRANERPPQPVAVAATGKYVSKLASRILELPDAELARLSGVAGLNALVITGPSEALPWCDGAVYLAAHGPLLWPTWAEPSVHPLLLEKALRRALPSVSRGPLALLISALSDTPKVVSLAAALPLSRQKLSAVAT